ncbi:hypothetical protein EVAR_21813_1, partial [Eumeta japonica]
MRLGIELKVELGWGLRARWEFETMLEQALKKIQRANRA